MIRVVIETLAHREQRYNTVGDWWVAKDGTWHVRVSSLNTWQQELCVAIHELVEMALCIDHGVTETQVDDFDKNWKEHAGADEPGNDLDAPYYHEHQSASAMERHLAAELAVNWTEYERVIDLMFNYGGDKPTPAEEDDDD